MRLIVALDKYFVLRPLDLGPFMKSVVNTGTYTNCSYTCLFTVCCVLLLNIPEYQVTVNQTASSNENVGLRVCSRVCGVSGPVLPRETISPINMEK